MTSIDAVIKYFVVKKFGVFSNIIPVMADYGLDKEGSYTKQVEEIKEYERSLRNVPTNELLSLYNKSITDDNERARQIAISEENARFYNQQSAIADFVHWAKAAHWTLDEAIALSFGKEPEQVNWAKIEPLKNKTKFAKDYAKRRDLALRATRWKKFGDTIPPVIFVSWAKEVKIDLPSELVAELENVGCTATNWREQYQKIKLALDALEHKKPENTQKAENLLKAIACVAIDAYGYDQNSAKSTAPKDIAEALKRHGITLDPKTIRGWLKDGGELLPRKPS